jgi:hypothetical protein
MKVPLLGGAYEAHSVIASAQRSLNLFAEPMPEHQGEPMPVAHYPTPGLRLLGVLPKGPVRGIRQSVTGGVYAVGGDTVYSVDPTSWAATALGTITGGLRTPVSMADNGLDMVIVDGSANGWHITLAGNAFAQIDNSAGTFYGADKVDYLDTYLLFNKPKTPQFYASDSLSLTFDPLWFANKESYSDLLVTLAVAKREIWLFGTQTTEIWFNSGKPDFPFESMPGIFIDHGCAAKYSVANYDNSVFWLTADRQGRGIVIMGAKYETKRISTYAIEAEIAGYERINDAIGFCYQLAGHTFYVLTFPRANHTWVHDITTGLWHEWLWIDANGDEHRHRANCYWPVNGVPVVGDWQNGNLYALDQDVYTDNGKPIKRVRSYPHILNDGKRVFYRQFMADMETGNAPGMLEGEARTVVDCTFTAPDDTPLEDYDNTLDVGATWSVLSGNAAILGNRMVGAGSALYQASGHALFPDYTLRFNVVPPAYDSVLSGTDVYAIGRSTGPGTGYKAEIRADGSQYSAHMQVLGTADPTVIVPMGTIPSGFYTVWLTMRGSFIMMQVQRSHDQLWLRVDGAWEADPGTIARAISDTTYAAPGNVMVGGVWP